jgi:hypothetical protein
MRVPRVRFTVRRLMAVVAVLAVLLGAGAEVVRLARLAEDYRQRAKYFVAAEDVRNLTVAAERMVDPGAARKPDRIAAHYAQLRRRYERAAARPWLPVAPDPPEPK